jgi:cytochrome o ubiquinol oxidase subunit 1
MNFWFPKVFGFTLNEFWGKVAFWCWLVGFFLTFTPLYVLGLDGMTRRMSHSNVPEWQPWLYVALCGALVIAAGILAILIQLAVSVRDRHANRDLTGDPWDARSLEWSTASPAPFYNFAITPRITSLEQHWENKETGRAHSRPARYEDIHMPRNTAAGLMVSVFATLMCFALVWHMWAIAAVGLVAAIATFILRSYDRDVDYYVPAAEVARIENARYAPLKEAA